MDPVYDYVAASLWPWLRLGMRWGIEGDDNIPRQGPVLLVSNHVSYLDPLIAGFVALRKGRRARFLAKQELFRPPLGLALRAMGQIPVARGTDTASDALARAVDALEKGECVVVFPEGTISHETFEPMAFKTGVARLMQRTGVPAVPMAIWGPQRLLTKGRPPALRPGVEVQVHVGEPLHADSGADVVATVDRVRAAVVRMLRSAQQAYAQHPAPDEDGWWTPRFADELAARRRRTV